MPESESNKINDLVQWLLTDGRRLTRPEELIDGFARRLAAAGVGLDRLMLSLTTRHPLLAATTYVWLPGQGAVGTDRPFSVAASAGYVASPVRAIHEGAGMLRARLAPPASDRTYPIYAELAAEGFTEYAAFALVFGDGTRNVLTVSSRRPGGFADADLALIRRALDPFALALEVLDGRRAAETMLATYVGREPGARILRGEFRRGVGETINAAILMADLRGFTRISDERPTTEVIAALNLYFDALVSAVHGHGGQVLKFMGDGLLAIFPLGDAAFAHYTARQAVDAALEARAAVAGINAGRGEHGLPELRFNVGLHVGEVVFGNIGAADRLDFTAIGPAVNVTARLEALAARLGAFLVMSEPFAALAAESRPVASLGRHALKGIAEAPEAFTLAEFAPAAPREAAPEFA
jgi:adenylate cyclase